RSQCGKFVADTAVVDHHQTRVAGQIVVMSGNREVVKGFIQIESALDRVHWAKAPCEINHSGQCREARRPTVKPDATDLMPGVITVVEAELLTLLVSQRGGKFAQRVAQFHGHDVTVVLAGLAGEIPNSVPFAAVRHVAGNDGEKIRVADLEHRAATVADFMSIEDMAARLAP